MSISNILSQIKLIAPFIEAIDLPEKEYKALCAELEVIQRMPGDNRWGVFGVTYQDINIRPANQVKILGRYIEELEKEIEAIKLEGLAELSRYED